MKKLCDKNIERRIRNEYFEELDRLSPTARFVRKLELMLDQLTLEVSPSDKLVGRFIFSSPRYENRAFSDEALPQKTEELLNRWTVFGSNTTFSKGHTLISYERILKEGLSGYAERINLELKATPKDEYLLAMRDTIKVVQAFLNRIALRIGELGTDCKIAEDSARLSEMKERILRVPFYPATDFYDALQSVWIIHFLAPLAEGEWQSISLGRLDKYLYPYYLISQNEGMTRAEAKAILHELFVLLNSYADGACLLNVGEEYNELSELLIECQRDFKLPGPILGARIGKDTPERILNMLIDTELFSRGQPTFYGEESCLKALIEKGLSSDRAKSFSNNSCMGIGIPGEEFNSMWGCIFGIHGVLEAAINQGRLITVDSNELIPDVKEVSTLDELYTEFEHCARFLLDRLLEGYNARAERSERIDPDCFISLLTEDCIQKRCDRISGARYHNVTVECIGLVNAADGIAAIDQLIFKEKRYSLSALRDALRADFIGYEELRRDILACPKFGQNSDADAYAVRVADILQALIRAYDNTNRYYQPSLHTLDKNATRGVTWGATPDGRRAGEPFAKNGGSSNLARRRDPTSLVLSAIKLPQHKLYGGQPIDLSFTPDTVISHKREIASLIKTYLGLGGLQLQVNAVSSKTLRDALTYPDRYPDLIVRIGGYSHYFNDLSPNVKLEFIERFEREGN